MQYIHKAYGLRHVIFASTSGDSLLLFEALHVPEPCQGATNGVSMLSSQVNELRCVRPGHTSLPRLMGLLNFTCRAVLFVVLFCAVVCCPL